MTTIELSGRITENGELEVKLPPGLPAGEVHIRIELPERSLRDQPWTEEEIRELLKFRPARSGAEIVAALESGELDTSAWTDANITDSLAWVEKLRRKEEKRYRW